MKFLVDTKFRFGSGSLAASMSLDGQAVLAQEWERDSCWDKGFAHVPLAEVRKVRKMILRKSSYPGGSYRFEGSGRQYISMLARETRRSPGGYSPRLGERGSLKEALLTDSWEWSPARKERAMEIARQGWLRQELERLQALPHDGHLAIKGEAIVKQIMEHDPRYRGPKARFRVKEEVVARAPYLL